MAIIVHDMTFWRRHNERHGISNHRRLNCLLNRLFRCRSKKTSKLRVTDLCEGNSPVTGGFPSLRPVTRKIFQCDGVIIWQLLSHHTATETYFDDLLIPLLQPRVTKNKYTFLCVRAKIYDGTIPCDYLQTKYRWRVYICAQPMRAEVTM